MRIAESQLSGVWVLELELREDSRGFFARTFCRREFAEIGIDFAAAQANVAVTYREGTVRGLHYQLPPAAESKLIRCTRGAVFDVVVDVRPDSPTFLRHASFELTAENRRELLVSAGFAHGYQALRPDSEVFYLVSEYYAPSCERGLRYDDPALGIEWPLPVIAVSAKDLSWPSVDRKAMRSAGRPEGRS